MRRDRIRLTAVVVAGLLLAGCGDGGDPTDGDTVAADPTGATEATEATEAPTMDMDESMDDSMDDGAMDDDMDMSGAYGEPAEASEADRTIEVEVDNELAFKPAEFEVAAGEVVTFQITNSGDLEHEFVLGDEQAQEQMGEEMEMDDDGHAHSGEMSNAVTVHPDESAELTWRFPEESTTVLVGCHVEGHWEGGMRGTVTVG